MIDNMTISFLELFIHIIQCILMVGFLYLFFDKPKSKALAISSYIITIIFTIFMGFGFINISIFSMVPVIRVLIILILYCLIGLRGKVYLRIMSPVIMMTIYLSVTYILTFFVSIITNTKLASDNFEEFTDNTYFYLLIVQFITLVVFTAVFIVIYKFGSKRLTLSSFSDILLFLICTIFSFIIICMSLLIFQETDWHNTFTNDGVDIVARVSNKILVILISVVCLCVSFWIMILKTNKKDKENTKLLLSVQKNALIEESTYSAYQKIDEIHKIKHDISNKLDSVAYLIDNENYGEAKDIINKTTDTLQNTYIPVNTKNPSLNAILNVKFDQIQKNSTAYDLDITTDMSFVESTDIISLLGNLLDNAIEYTLHHNIENPYIALNIFNENDYTIISCKNSIETSVLDKNPKLKTTKDEYNIHGKGIEIIKEIANKYSGDIHIAEKDNVFSVNIMLQNSSTIDN